MGNPQKTLTSLSSCVERFVFDRGTGSISLDIDLDAFTESYFREVGNRQRQRMIDKFTASQTNGNGNGNGHQPTSSLGALEIANVDVLENSEDESEEQQKADSKEEQRKAHEQNVASVDMIWNAAAENIEAQKLLRIDMLLLGDTTNENSVLKGWDAEKMDGSPLPLTSEILNQLSGKALEELWEFCADKVRSVKKTTTVQATQ